MTFEKYSRILDKLVDRHWAVAHAETTAKMFMTNFGRIDGKIFLIDDSYLDFSEEILIAAKQVTKLRYRYEYIKNRNEIFRYDNFPKRPGIRPPFHHKHVSKRRAIQVQEAPKLNLST